MEVTHEQFSEGALNTTTYQAPCDPLEMEGCLGHGLNTQGGVALTKDKDNRVFQQMDEFQ